MAKDAEEFNRSLGSIKNLLFTALADHAREKKLLRAPFYKLHFASWKDHALSPYSWAALTTNLLSRDQYLPIFREISGRIRYRHDKFGDEIYVNHASLKDTANAQFEFIFELLLSQKENRDKYADLAKLQSLPDRAHWLRYETSEKKGLTSVRSQPVLQSASTINRSKQLIFDG
jgi:hypothetical protein